MTLRVGQGGRTDNLAQSVAPNLGQVQGLSQSQSQTAAQIMSILMQGGLSAAGAAGMVGNWVQESSLNPNASGGGLAQWIGSRYGALQSYAASIGKSPNTVDAQARFALQELQTTYPNLYATLGTITDPGSAALMISNQYERPAASAANNPRRVGMAKAVYAAYTGNPDTGGNGTGGGGGGGASGAFTNVLGDAVNISIPGGGGIVGGAAISVFRSLAPIAGSVLSIIAKDMVMGIGDYVIIPIWHWNQRAVDYYLHTVLASPRDPRYAMAMPWTAVFWAAGYIILFTDPDAKDLKPAPAHRSHLAKHTRRLQSLPARRELIHPKKVKERTPKKPKERVSSVRVIHTNTVATSRPRIVKVHDASNRTGPRNTPAPTGGPTASQTKVNPEGFISDAPNRTGRTARTDRRETTQVPAASGGRVRSAARHRRDATRGNGHPSRGK